jgi:hypothetical protein
MGGGKLSYFLVLCKTMGTAKSLTEERMGR